MTIDSFKTQTTSEVGASTTRSSPWRRWLGANPAVGTLPFSLRVLLENLLRHEDGRVVKREHVEKMLAWNAKAAPTPEISFHVARCSLQDFTGVPAVVDLAAMREAHAALGGDPSGSIRSQPADLVIDHSVHGGPVRDVPRLPGQRRAGVRAQPRALRVPPLGPGSLPELPRWCRPTPASATR